jgi:hypothetical protein
MRAASSRFTGGNDPAGNGRRDPGTSCNSVNERDLSLLNSYANLLNSGEAGVFGGSYRGLMVFCGSLPACGSLMSSRVYFLEGLFESSEWKFEAITGL